MIADFDCLTRRLNLPIPLQLINIRSFIVLNMDACWEILTTNDFRQAQRVHTPLCSKAEGATFLFCCLKFCWSQYISRCFLGMIISKKFFGSVVLHITIKSSLFWKSKIPFFRLIYFVRQQEASHPFLKRICFCWLHIFNS